MIDGGPQVSYVLPVMADILVASATFEGESLFPQHFSRRAQVGLFAVRSQISFYDA